MDPLLPLDRNALQRRGLMQHFSLFNWLMFDWNWATVIVLWLIAAISIDFK